jgi:hypothetical protein
MKDSSEAEPQTNWLKDRRIDDRKIKECCGIFLSSIFLSSEELDSTTTRLVN